MLESANPGRADPRAIRGTIAAARLAPRIWATRDRCLPRSIALATVLRRQGSDAKLVLGVALDPFAAHAWVQDGATVLNDSVDHVLLFTPILIL